MIKLNGVLLYICTLSVSKSPLSPHSGVNPFSTILWELQLLLAQAKPQRHEMGIRFSYLCMISLSVFILFFRPENKKDSFLTMKTEMLSFSANNMLAGLESKHANATLLK